MDSNNLEREDLLDRLVAEYADRFARDEDPGRAEMLEKHPDLREELLRCFRMIEAGTAPAAQVTARIAAGVRLGDYQILHELGRGAMGVVYLADDPKLRRRVALKVLRHHLTLEARHVSRFEREARLAARLRHPNVVAIHSVGEQDGHHFIAMDYLQGPTLAGVIQQLANLPSSPTAADLAKATNNQDLAGCLSYVEAAVRCLLPIFSALSAAHDAGLVHRDVKPSNILFDRNGNIAIADFGLAKGEGDVGLTLSGEPVGTPYYMAPEQVAVAAKTTDARTDVYSLGVTLFELLTLRRPYEAPSFSELVNQILSYPTPHPRQYNKNIPKNLERVVLCAIAKNPESRYASIAPFAEDLERALAGGKVLAKKASGNWYMGARPGFGSRNYPMLGYEYKSPISIFGLPLVHITSGLNPSTGRPYKSVGIIAIGNQAYGGFAFGGLAIGIVAFGGMAIGLLAAFGGAAIGAIACGGAAAGGIAVGGGAFGYYAWGGGAAGEHVIDAARRDPEALEFFNKYAPFLMQMMNRYGTR
jgi:serine/threonine protein kinase